MTNVAGIETSQYGRPCSGEIVSGDTAVIVALEGGVFLGLADVLGHGPRAHAVAREIESWLTAHAGPDLLKILGELHQRLRGTLGAAVGLAYLEATTGRLRYSGVGNSCLRRFGRVETRLVTRDGVVGERMRTPREELLQLNPGDLVLLSSDGVKEHFGSEEYPGLLRDPAATVARTVVQRFGREHDDATCIALRYQP
jgi:phosphoserine phosphatase RsbX